MSEIAAFAEGSLYVYTGSHTASGNPVAYVQNESPSPSRAWQSEPAVDGTYRGHYTDERANFSFGVGYLIGSELPLLFDLATAVHLKFLAVVPGIGSAGYHFYSGVLTNAPLAGGEGGVYAQTFNGFCHSWSAF